MSERSLVARNIVHLTLEPIAGELPEARIGAHIEVLTPAGQSRNYSLTSGSVPTPGRYEIAVARNDDGDGGSVSMHDDVKVGTQLSVSPPTDGFVIDEAVSDYLLIAGGVGITVIRALFHELRRRGVGRVRLVYLARCKQDAAFVEEFIGPDVILHYTTDSGGARYELWPELRFPGNRRLYCCGPAPLMDAVRMQTMHWRESRLHFEDFRGVPAFDEDSRPFSVVWEPSRQKIVVPADKTMLESLEAAGVAIKSSCRGGTCGTCVVRLHSGVIDHRDLVLNPIERFGQLMPCVSRVEGEAVIGPMP